MVDSPQVMEMTELGDDTLHATSWAAVAGSATLYDLIGSNVFFWGNF
jgi:hypothetical protein